MIALVEWLNEKHCFLFRKRYVKENAFEFVSQNNAGIALEGFQARFWKYKIWWKDGHEFGVKQGGLPFKWKNYLYALRVQLGKDA